jgi:hypothetical protein
VSPIWDNNRSSALHPSKATPANVGNVIRSSAMVPRFRGFVA